MSDLTVWFLSKCLQYMQSDKEGFHCPCLDIPEDNCTDDIWDAGAVADVIEQAGNVARIDAQCHQSVNNNLKRGHHHTMLCLHMVSLVTTYQELHYRMEKIERLVTAKGYRALYSKSSGLSRGSLNMWHHSALFCCSH